MNPLSLILEPILGVVSGFILGIATAWLLAMNPHSPASIATPLAPMIAALTLWPIVKRRGNRKGVATLMSVYIALCTYTIVAGTGVAAATLPWHDPIGAYYALVALAAYILVDRTIP